MALGLCAWAAVSSVDHYDERKAAHYQSESNNDAGAGNEQVETYCVELPRQKARACVTKPPTSEDEQKRAKQDLQAQQDMAKWAYAMFLASIGGIILSALGLVFVGVGLVLNLRANQQSREFFIAERRAWLSVTVEVPAPWERHLNEGRFYVKVTAKNVGHTPATNVHFHIPEDTVKAFAGDDLKRFRDEIERHKSEWGAEVGDTIFPQEPFDRGARVSVPLLEGGNGDFYLPVFVSYRYAGSDKVHVTPVVQHVGFSTFVSLNEKRIDWCKAHHMGVAPD